MRIEFEDEFTESLKQKRVEREFEESCSTKESSKRVQIKFKESSKRVYG